jgi:hypothetical protein
VLREKHHFIECDAYQYQIAFKSHYNCRGHIMYGRLFAAFAALSIFSGCAIHPVPEDVAGVDTYHIVRQIRCETREALKTFLITWLDDLGSEHNGRPGDPIARRLADQYAREPEAISNFRSKEFPGPQYVQVRALIDLFYAAGIGYNFDLTMTENNDLTTEINLLKPLTEPKFTLGINAGALRERSNNRLFTVTDTFSYLLTQLNTPVRGKRYCDGQIVHDNYVYPIAGRIGIDKLVRTFIELTLFANLAGKEAHPGAGGAPTMADTLTFTTAINVSATPKIEFSPVGRAFQLADASLTATVKRKDIHQVTVALAIATEDMVTLDPFRSYLFSSQRGASVATATPVGRRRPVTSSIVVGRRVTGGGTPSEALAVVAIDQLKSRELQLRPAP